MFSQRHALIGVVHLAALPGSPSAQLSMADITERALADAEAYLANGMDGVIIENFGDAPFFPSRVEGHTIAQMTLVAAAVRERFPNAPLGINVLRNDARAALAIAATVGAQFIRVNIHTGAMLTDQGVIEGAAFDTLRYRATLNSDIHIWADIAVKHAAPLAPVTLRDSARDTYLRGKADALILTGAATGAATDPDEIRSVRQAVPAAPLYIGSGVSERTIADTLSYADGAIVGTALKKDAIVHNPVDAQRVRALVELRNTLA